MPLRKTAAAALVLAAGGTAALGARARGEAPLPVPSLSPGERAARAARRADDLRQLARAIVEADADCEAARDLEAALSGKALVLLSTAEIERAAANPLVVSSGEGDTARLVAALRFLRALAQALPQDAARARALLEKARLSPEDARLLVGAVHARLDRALERARASSFELEEIGPSPSHRGGAECYEKARLSQFRGLGVESALSSW